MVTTILSLALQLIDYKFNWVNHFINITPQNASHEAKGRQLSEDCRFLNMVAMAGKNAVNLYTWMINKHLNIVMTIRTNYVSKWQA